MSVPFIVFADFESFIKPIDTCQPNLKGSYINKYPKHTPSSFCYYVKCFDDNVYSQDPVAYTTESKDDYVAQIFVDTLEENIKQIYNRFKFPKMIFSKDGAERYNNATMCHICNGKFIAAGKDIKLKVHCHFSDTFRGANHNSCNINYNAAEILSCSVS